MSPPLLQLRGRRVDVTADAAQIDAAAAAIAERWHVRVPQLLHPELLAQVHAEISGGAFKPMDHPGVGTELCFVSDRLTDRLMFLLNDPAVLGLMERLSGQPHLGCFIGRIYRVMPGAGHVDHWHDDQIDHRHFTLTLNLSAEVYRGSTLRMRRKGEPDTAFDIPNTSPGDAVLFALRPELEHRITDIEGDVPKTALAGWFCAKPDFADLIRSPRAAKG